MNFVGALKRLYHLLPEPPSTNYLYRRIDPNPYELLPPNPLIVDVGSKEARGAYAFGVPPAGSRLLCVDMQPGPGVDIVADAHDMKIIGDNTVDLVVCVSVLEHVRYPHVVIKEIFRILKPGGIAYINIPFIFPFHGDPSDFYRFSYKGIEILCEDFERLDSGFNRGPASTMHHLLVHFFGILFSLNSKVLYGVFTDLFKWLLFWVKYLDKFIARYDVAYVIHAGSYFLGRKAKTPSISEDAPQ